MTKITEFNNKSLKNFRADMAVVFAKYEKESGVKVALTKISFSADSATAKIEMTVAGGATKMEKDFALLSKYDSIAFTVGEPLMSMSIGECKIVGANTRATKYPYIVKEKSNGALYKMSASNLKDSCKSLA